MISPTATLLAALDEAFDHRAWHGPNLRGALRNVPARQAVWRPGPKRHCIAEIALHCAYWKYAVRRALTGEKRGSFPLKGSNWFPIAPRLDEQNWRELLELLDDQHAALRAAVAAVPPDRLAGKPPGGKHSRARLIGGAALHDVYHAGQIRLLKSLFVRAGSD